MGLFTWGSIFTWFPLWSVNQLSSSLLLLFQASPCSSGCSCSFALFLPQPLWSLSRYHSLLGGTTPKLISLLGSGTSPFHFFWLFSFCVVCHLSSFAQVSMISFCNPFFTRVLPSICLHFEKRSLSPSAVEPGLKTTFTECLDILLKTWPNFHLAAALKLYSNPNVAC